MAAKKQQVGEPAGYAEAMTELESILSEIDSSTVDVDVLASRVERASFLINWCQDRISAAQLTIDSLVMDDSDIDDED